MTADIISKISLQKLALLYGIQPAYYGADHHRHSANIESLWAVLKELGAPIISFEDISSAIQEREVLLAQQMLEPVLVAWDGIFQSVPIRCPVKKTSFPIYGRLIRETGETMSWSWDSAELPTSQQEIGRRYVIKQLPISELLPLGYHHFILEIPGKNYETMVIAAPRKAYLPSCKSESKAWGVFLPLYALRSRDNWASGDFSSLEKLLTWVNKMGGSLVATLPLLATFLDEPLEPSPYSPVSRLLWNEFYLEISKIPEVAECLPALSLLSSPQFQREIEVLKNQSLVDYHSEMILKRRVFMELSRCFFNKQSQRRIEFQHFVSHNPVVEDYARFRATCEWQNVKWRLWQQKLRDGVIGDGDYDQEAQRYHLYVQWLASQQIEAFSQKARRQGPGLYLDYPVGVHADGYDVWRRQDLFLSGISLGAPPDAVFTSGQNWASPPQHPQKIRLQKYDYFIACLQHHMRHAGILRIDHMMSFHRLYWIPQGMDPAQGVYVRYHPDELYAILTLESHRNKTMVVGEDLGIVPPDVRPSMAQHGLQRMYIMQYQFLSNSSRPLRTPPANSIASLNTHDMPPFASFWQGMDIQYRRSFGLIEEENAAREIKERQDIKNNIISFLRRRLGKSITKEDIYEVLKSMLLELSSSNAEIVLINLEDLWLETQPQNVPGAMTYANWRKKAHYSFEEFSILPQVLDLLKAVNQNRLKRAEKTSYRTREI